MIVRLKEEFKPYPRTRTSKRPLKMPTSWLQVLHGQAPLTLHLNLLLLFPPITIATCDCSVLLGEITFTVSKHLIV